MRYAVFGAGVGKALAYYLARGEAKPGVRTPENAFEVEQLRPMIEELKKHFVDFKIECKAA